MDQLLSEARSSLDRLTPREAQSAAIGRALLVDIRSDSEREADGRIPNAAFVPRNALEWRLDPQSAHRDRALARRDVRIILLCNQGYQSSLAAATLRAMGLDATDVIGGFQAWREAGLPVDRF